MNKIRFALNLLTVFGFTLTLASLAEASQRVFVSSGGNDANPCTLPSPCRTFSKAMTVVEAGGEIIALNSAGYGPFTINKSVSVIAAPGVYAGITAAGAGITIAAGASDVVVLRGLTLVGPGTSGIEVDDTNVGALHIENCVINGFSGSGIKFVPNNAAQLFVKDTVVRNTNSLAAIRIISSFSVRATLDHCRLERNSGGGLLVSGSNTKATVRDSTAAGILGSGASGFFASGSGELNIENCVATSNSLGIGSETNATVRVSNTMVTNNGTGLYNNDLAGATLISFGNNKVRGNITDKSGTITVVSLD